VALESLFPYLQLCVHKIISIRMFAMSKAAHKILQMRCDVNQAHLDTPRQILSAWPRA
jgi:hypothetical protein